MTDVLSPEQLADREALRALLKDEVQRNFELGLVFLMFSATFSEYLGIGS